MQQQKAAFQIKGMNQDLADSKFNPEFAYENHNIRITPTNDNTLLILTNEKGNTEVSHTPLSVVVDSTTYTETERNILGYAVLYKTIVLFEHNKFSDNTYRDCINTLRYNGSAFVEGNLYIGDLKFHLNKPIETLPLYESETIQKVYWVDGKNQPRVINIDTTSHPIIPGDDTQFDFLVSLHNEETVSVERAVTLGQFPGGTLQYGFTYSKKNGQESNIVWISKLLYPTFDTRAASPEELTTSSYKITIQNADTAFDYINIYSVLKTSRDGGIIAKLVTRLDIVDVEPTGGYTYTDTNTGGEIIEPSELLYKGGQDFVAYTLSSKDNTLFLGNIEYKGNSVSDDIKSAARELTVTTGSTTIANWKQTDGFYPSQNPLIYDSQITYLRCGNKYRIGLQLQDTKGTWSEPIFVKDHLCTTRPILSGTNLLLPKVQINITTAFLNEIDTTIYKKIRPVVVFPNVDERGVIAQGIVCSTVFSPENRNTNTPFAQSSWFFRPYNKEGYDGTSGTKYSLEARHLHALPQANKYNAEIQCSLGGSGDTYAVKTTSDTISNKDFYIDGSIITFHSPDVNNEMNDALLTNCDLKIVGALQIDAVAGRCVTTSNATIANRIPESQYNVDRGLGDTSIWSKNLFSIQTLFKYIIGTSTRYSATYPWHNDFWCWDASQISPTATVTTLTTKVLSNIRVSQGFAYFTSSNEYTLPSGLRDRRVFREVNGDSSIRLAPPTNMQSSTDALYYLGTYRKPIFPSANYSIYFSDSFDGTLTTDATAGSGYLTREPVNIQYRSTDHIVLALNNDSSGRLCELPVPNFGASYVDKTQSNYSGHPYWLQSATGGDTIMHTFDSSTFVVLESERTYFISSYTNNSIVLSVTPSTNNTLPWTIVVYRFDSSNSSFTTEYLDSAVNVLDMSACIGVGSFTYQIPYTRLKVSTSDTGHTWTSTEEYTFGQALDLPVGILTTNEVMWITELRREIPAGIFGGTSEFAIKSNQWLPCGEAKSIPLSADTVDITEGDTIFNRWDCVKTMPYSTEDVNQIVEIMSFMCESYVNTAGRYDKNKGLQDYTFLTAATPFNLINDAYNNKDNFFSYRITDLEKTKNISYPTHIAWSLTKTLGEEIDSWTNITLGPNTLQMDGDKGKVRAIRRFKNSLFTFQDKGIAEIIFNPSAVIATNVGVPIQIANSGKVEGKRYISDTVGCTNKWSICNTSEGMYFIDSIDKKIYAWTDNGMICLSDQLGFTSWINSQITGVNDTWSPTNFNDIITQYDRSVGDVYFITNSKCLAFNEKLKQFTSFYNYEATPFFINLDNKCISFHSHKLWDQHQGNYNSFFGIIKPYSVELIVNPNPTVDKVFTDIDFRSDSWSGDTLLTTTYDTLQAWNEYQNGSYSLVNTKDKPSTLKKKFRIWHAKIPRNTTNKGGDENHNYTRDRIRNTWMHLKLSKQTPSTEKTTLHDIVVTYYM